LSVLQLAVQAVTYFGLFPIASSQTTAGDGPFTISFKLTQLTLTPQPSSFQRSGLDNMKTSGTEISANTRGVLPTSCFALWITKITPVNHWTYTVLKN
jgi:hypothetical protein